MILKRIDRKSLEMIRGIAEDRDSKGDCRMLKLIAFELADRIESAYREITIREERIKELQTQIRDLSIETKVLEVRK